VSCHHLPSVVCDECRQWTGGTASDGFAFNEKLGDYIIKRLEERVAELEKRLLDRPTRGDVLKITDSFDQRLEALEPKFKVGDQVVLRDRGVCEIVEVEMPRPTYHLSENTGPLLEHDERDLSLPKPTPSLAERLRELMGIAKDAGEHVVTMGSLEELLDEESEHCPTCDSPSPKLHPAVQHEGEARICSDAFHAGDAK